MKPAKKSYLLYAVTDRSWLNGRTLLSQVNETIQNGTTFLQLREKDLSFVEFLAEAQKIKSLTDRYGIPFVINDNIEIALAVDADGVHVGQSDMEAAEVRLRIGPDKILGVSVETVEQAVKAERDGADYLGVGAVFSTQTKLDAETVNLVTLKEITQNVSIPVVAIGGIGKDNILQLKGCGLAGVAVVSAIFASADIGQATQHLKELALEITKPEIKGMIFDMDGTLLDSMASWDNIGVDYVIGKGITPPPGLKATLRNMSFSESAAYFISQLGLDLTPERIINEINAMVENNYKYHLDLKPHVKEYLEQVKAKSLPACVVTSTDHELAVAALKRLEILDYFQFILTCEEIGISKNYPDIYLLAAQKLGAPPREIAVFEDALYCIKTVRKAGFYVVGVADEQANGETHEIKSLSDLYIHSFHDAEVLLK